MSETGTDSAAVRALSEDAYEDTLEDLRAKTDKAQSEGNSRKANRLYAEQQAFIGARQGDGPIVDGRRTA